MSQPIRYLLDTNILVHLIRQDALWAKLRDRFNLLVAEPTPLISIVTAGELRSLATQNDWGPKKLDQIEFALGYFVRFPVDDERLVRAYAGIDSAMIGRGVEMGKNDLWIAATTLVTGAHLLTTDKDFVPLTPSVIPGERIDPTAR